MNTLLKTAPVKGFQAKAREIPRQYLSFSGASNAGAV